VSGHGIGQRVRTGDPKAEVTLLGELPQSVESLEFFDVGADPDWRHPKAASPVTFVAAHGRHRPTVAYRPQGDAFTNAASASPSTPAGKW
jgi:hypothetical protein